MPPPSTHLAVGILFLATLTGSVTASAQEGSEEPRDVWEQPFALTGHVSVGGPIGLFGVELEWTPHPLLSMALGVGYNTAGPQAMARIGMQVTEGMVGFGLAGVGALGPEDEEYPVLTFDPDYEGPGYDRHWDIAGWIGGELYVAVRAPGGFAVRMYLGHTANLNPDDGVCSAGSPSEVALCEQEGAPAFFYTGVGFGYSW